MSYDNRLRSLIHYRYRINCVLPVVRFSCYLFILHFYLVANGTFLFGRPLSPFRRCALKLGHCSILVVLNFQNRIVKLLILLYLCKFYRDVLFQYYWMYIAMFCLHNLARVKLFLCGKFQTHFKLDSKLHSQISI